MDPEADAGRHSRTSSTGTTGTFLLQGRTGDPILLNETPHRAHGRWGKQANLQIGQARWFVRMALQSRPPEMTISPPLLLGSIGEPDGRRIRLQKTESLADQEHQIPKTISPGLEFDFSHSV